MRAAAQIGDFGLHPGFCLCRLRSPAGIALLYQLNPKPMIDQTGAVKLDFPFALHQ